MFRKKEQMSESGVAGTRQVQKKNGRGPRDKGAKIGVGRVGDSRRQAYRGPKIKGSRKGKGKKKRCTPDTEIKLWSSSPLAHGGGHPILGQIAADSTANYQRGRVGRV